MKIARRPLIAMLLGGILVTQTGCFGSFALTKKTYEFHDSATNSKFVKSLLFWIPGGLVYPIVTGLDVIIFNLIEFWGGSNPISMNEGDHEMQLMTHNGEQFRIDATKDTFTTTQLTGEQAGEVRIMRFDRESLTWNYSDSDVQDMAVMTFLDATGDHVRIYTNDGTIELTAAELGDAAALCTTASAN